MVCRCLILSGCFALALVGNLESATAGVFRFLEVPGAQSTTSNGFYGYDVIGTYKDQAGGTHGFLYRGTSYIALGPPGAVTSTAQFANGRFVFGTYTDAGGVTRNYAYDGSRYTFPNVPGALSTTVRGADANQIFGTYSDGTRTHGFVYDGSTYRTVDMPGSTSTNIIDVYGNEVLGTSNGAMYQPFLYDGVGYKTIAFPGGTNTRAVGLAGRYVFGEFFNPDPNANINTTLIFKYDGSNYSLIDPYGFTSDPYLTYGPYRYEAVATWGDEMLAEVLFDGFLHAEGLLMDGYGARILGDFLVSSSDAYTFVHTVSGHSVGADNIDPRDRPFQFLFDDGAYYYIGQDHGTVSAVSGDRALMSDGSIFQSTPEPGSLLLLSLGTAVLVGARRVRVSLRKLRRPPSRRRSPAVCCSCRSVALHSLAQGEFAVTFEGCPPSDPF